MNKLTGVVDDSSQWLVVSMVSTGVAIAWLFLHRTLRPRNDRREHRRNRPHF